MAFATFCIRIVLPALGGATINKRCPLPIGAKRSTIRPEISVETVSSFNFSSGYNGVRFSKGTRVWAIRGSSKFTDSMRSKAKNRSPSFGERVCP